VVVLDPVASQLPEMPVAPAPVTPKKGAKK